MVMNNAVEKRLVGKVGMARIISTARVRASEKMARAILRMSMEHIVDKVCTTISSE
jgi:hypothetical protein